MAERAVATAKKPEAKKTCSNFCRQNTGFNSSVSTVDMILQLQKTAGNRAVQKLIKSGTLQAKLRIGPPNDVYEQEADRIAEQVMKTPEPKFQCQLEKGQDKEQIRKKPLNEKIMPLVQQQVEPDREEEKEPIQAKTASDKVSEVAPSIQASITDLNGSGQTLPESTRALFEPRFGQDFSHVRVHTDSKAIESARRLNAQAYTIGSDLVFGAGQYVPETSKGQRLLAHELTHVVQQGAAKNNSLAQLSIQKTSGHQVMRSLALESTVKICHRVLTSRNIKVSKGGLRVVLIFNQLDTKIPNCQNHSFWVTLTRSVDWLPDNEISTCEAETGGTRSFMFGKLPPGTYYLTIHRVFDHPYCCLEGEILVFDEFIDSDSSSCIRDKDLSAMDIVHGALDIAGFIPVLGAIPDGINAVIYVVEGDWQSVGLSAVAMVPGWGDGVKLGTMAGKSVIKISEKAAIKLGEEGIAKGLKEVKAASKVEKATLETTEEVTKMVKAGKKPSVASGLGEAMIKAEHKTGISADVAAQAHKHKTEFRAGSGKLVESAHMVPTVAVKKIHGYSRSEALTILLPEDAHRAFDGHWKDWARQTAKQLRKQGLPEQVTVAEWEAALNRAAQSVPELVGRTSDTMSFMIRTEFYQTLGLKTTDILPLPRFK